MSNDDIPLICKADHNESERNIAYLRNQLANQDTQECSALIALDLIVFEEYRQKGIATNLMNVAEDIAKDIAIKYIWMFV